jgi:hypothetical protein
MVKKSGLDMIEEICEVVATFDRRLQNMEHLMKQMLSSEFNRGSSDKLNSGQNQQVPKGLKLNNKPAQIRPNTNSTLEAGKPIPREIKVEGAKIQNKKKKEKPKIKVAPNIRVMGRIKDDNSKGISKVNVTIYDVKNNVVKETRTNAAGDWIAFLPPGRYGAKCFLEDRVNGNVTFTVLQGEELINVGQPQ